MSGLCLFSVFLRASPSSFLRKEPALRDLLLCLQCCMTESPPSPGRGCRRRRRRNSVRSLLIFGVPQGFAQLLSEKGACVTGLLSRSHGGLPVFPGRQPGYRALLILAAEPPAFIDHFPQKRQVIAYIRIIHQKRPEARSFSYRIRYTFTFGFMPHL